MSLGKTISAYRHWKIIGVLLLLVAIGMLGVESSGVPIARADDPTLNDTPTAVAPSHSAIISNGTVQLGVLDQAHLGVGGGSQSSGGAQTTTVGVRYVPLNYESTAQGCVCEGWGVADAGTGQHGEADVAVGGVNNLSVNSFTSTANSAVSVVTAFGRLRVTHDFHPTSLTANLYEVEVTIENVSTTDVTDLRYTRTMDWDTDPTPFNEYVTIQGVLSATNLLYADDDGFANPNPLGSRYGNAGNQIDSGPTDHGAHFDFGFGLLPAGGTQTFKIFYGAAPSQTAADAALGAVGAEAYSYGQSNDGASSHLTGEPVTYIFAFSGVGGSVLIPPDLLLEPASDTNFLGENHTLTATATDNGSPVVGATVTFEVISGPNTGVLGTAVTNSSGVATHTYTSSLTGTDQIIAHYVDGSSVTQTSNPVTKEWVTPPNVAPTCSDIIIDSCPAA